MKDLAQFKMLAIIILIVGGINWGLVGLFNLNLISAILGNVLGRLIFIVVGVAAGYMCYMFYLEKFKKP